MQSWQADLVNLGLSLSMKPMLRHVRSLNLIRAGLRVSDEIVGRAIVPFSSKRQAVEIPEAAFNAEWIQSGQGQVSRYLLYLPGGAYVLRTPNFHAAMVSRICRAAEARALITYYRLAPEFPFPACLEDSLCAYRWMIEQGIEPARIVLAGDSAGGGLALSTLLAIRQRGLPMPACAYLLAPLLDASDASASRWKNAYSDSALPSAHRRALNPRHLVIGDRPVTDPLISPIYGDFTGLPPLYVQISDSELLYDDALRLARRCHSFNVEVNVDIWHKVPHVFQIFGLLPESRDAIRKAGEFLRAHTAQTVTEEG